ncbi:MAG: DsbA family protein [Rhizobiaceae bacterium]|nr:DsbA family protein [Rhizobiaceae bacterium]
MKNAIVVGTLGIGLSFAMLAVGYLSGSGSPAAARPSDAPLAATLERGEIEAIVRDYLITNPEIMLEVQIALEEKQEQDRRLAQSQAIATSPDLIFNADYDGVVGNPEGDITVVEFFDYNCGYCKRALADMQALVADDPDLRFVMKEFPILGPDSRKAHLVSMAFRTLAPDQYGDFHQALLSHPGRADEASAMRIALSFGLDEASLRAEMDNPEIEQAFAETYNLASALSVTGTPSYVVGNEVIFGAQGRDALAASIATAREN